MEDRAARLMLKAVRLLPPREQDQIVKALLKSAMSEPAPVTNPPPAVMPPGVLMRDWPGPISSPGAMTGPTAMLPVRLPPELHERLRAWSGEHGFSMASVVRGLVERFLDEQGGTPRRSGAGAGTKPKAGPKSMAKRATARG